MTNNQDPLNFALYARIAHFSKSVIIKSPGISNRGTYIDNQYTGGKQLHLKTWGEAYNVNCPYCSDYGHSLSVNHKYGEFDNTTRSRNYHLIKCYANDCFKVPGRSSEFYETLPRVSLPAPAKVPTSPTAAPDVQVATTASQAVLGAQTSSNAQQTVPSQIVPATMATGRLV